VKADLKTKPTLSSVPAFIGALQDPVRRADAKVLAALMRKATGEKPVMWGAAIIGFGRYTYKYESGREGVMPTAGFSPRKTASVLYLHRNFAGAETLLAALGKHTTGKSCLYIPKLSGVDMKVLEELVVRSVAAVRARH
jgi:hypothetical protein